MSEYKFDKHVRSGESIGLFRYTEHSVRSVHNHDFIELAYVLSGSGIHYINGVEKAVCAGHVCFINYNASHCFISDEKAQPLDVLNILFTPETFESIGVNFEEFVAMASERLHSFLFDEESEEKSYMVISDESNAIRNLFETMYKEYVEQNDGYKSMLVGYLCQLFIKFMRIYKKQCLSKGETVTNQPEYINMVIEYVQNNYSNKITLSELSKIALLSPNHFCKIFKNLTGKTVSEYIQRLRIEKACDLLKDKDKSIEMIAGLVGYKNTVNFRRAFKKEMGCLPNDYRKRI